MIRATAFGEGILEHGVEELMQQEAAYREQYGAEGDWTQTT
jgi:hypothetical protein